MMRSPRRFAAFLIASGLATLADVTMFTAFVAIGTPRLASVVAGFLANSGTAFLLNRYVVFSDSTNSTATASWRFAAMLAVNVAVAIGGVSLLVAAGWPYLLARILSSTILVTLNFVASHHWVFGIARDED